LFLFRHDQHPRSRRQRRNERVGGAALPVRKFGLLWRAESGPSRLGQVRVGCLGAPAGGRVTRANGRASADSRQPGDPIDLVVQDVPQAGQDAARYQDPGDLGSCDGHVEPMHGVAGQHSIDGRIRQRYRFGATRQCTDRRSA
jgi:hypothetical protein